MMAIVQVGLYAIRAFVAVVLVAAGCAKLVDLPGFATTLSGLGAVPSNKPLTRTLAVIVPLIEVSLGIALATALGSEVVSIAVAALMTVFVAITVVAMRRKLEVTCRCFGALGESRFNKRGLARAIGLWALSAILVMGGGIAAISPNEAPLNVLLLGMGYLIFGVATAHVARAFSSEKGS